MLTPDKPLVLTLRGSTSVALKNDRIMKTSKDQQGKTKARLIKSTNVMRWLRTAKTTIERQCQEQQLGSLLETRVAVVCEVHVCFHSAFPRNDLDNFYTTAQEALMQTVLIDDKQIEQFTVFRLRASSKQHEYAKLFIWEVQTTWYDDLTTFLTYYKESKNESRFIESSSNPDTGIDQRLRKAEVTNWF